MHSIDGGQLTSVAKNGGEVGKTGMGEVGARKIMVSEMGER